MRYPYLMKYTSFKHYGEFYLILNEEVAAKVCAEIIKNGDGKVTTVYECLGAKEAAQDLIDRKYGEGCYWDMKEDILEQLPTELKEQILNNRSAYEHEKTDIEKKYNLRIQALKLCDEGNDYEALLKPARFDPDNSNMSLAQWLLVNELVKGYPQITAIPIENIDDLNM